MLVYFYLEIRGWTIIMDTFFIKRPKNSKPPSYRGKEKIAAIKKESLALDNDIIGDLGL